MVAEHEMCSDASDSERHKENRVDGRSSRGRRMSRLSQAETGVGKRV
jgi:hypothetical protein